MDGENNGNDLLKMNDVGVPLFLETPILLGCPGSQEVSKIKGDRISGLL